MRLLDLGVQELVRGQGWKSRSFSLHVALAFLGKVPKLP